METVLVLAALSVALVAGVAFVEANRSERPSLDGSRWQGQCRREDG